MLLLFRSKALCDLKVEKRSTLRCQSVMNFQETNLQEGEQEGKMRPIACGRCVCVPWCLPPACLLAPPFVTLSPSCAKSQAAFLNPPVPLVARLLYFLPTSAGIYISCTLCDTCVT